MHKLNIPKIQKDGIRHYGNSLNDIGAISEDVKKCAVEVVGGFYGTRQCGNDRIKGKLVCKYHQRMLDKLV